MVRGFSFMFSKQHKNNFQKIKPETGFQIIIFIFCVLAPTFKNNFQNTKHASCIVDYIAWIEENPCCIEQALIHDVKAISDM